jgi:hypothetical protein
MKTEDGFVAVQAPVGAEVPKEAEKVEVSDNVNNYYYGGAFSFEELNEIRMNAFI